MFFRRLQLRLLRKIIRKKIRKLFEMLDFEIWGFMNWGILKKGHFWHESKGIFFSLAGVFFYREVQRTNLYVILDE